MKAAAEAPPRARGRHPFDSPTLASQIDADAQLKSRHCWHKAGVASSCAGLKLLSAM